MNNLYSLILILFILTACQSKDYLGDEKVEVGAGTSSSNWSKNGSDVYYTSGNVGVGTTAPDALLTVNKDFNGATNIKASNTDNGASAGASFISYNNSAAGYMDFGISSVNYAIAGGLFANRGYIEAGADTDGMVINNNSATGPMIFASGTSEVMRITDTGIVGIGTTAPTGNLHVKGSNVATGWDVVTFEAGSISTNPNNDFGGLNLYNPQTTNDNYSTLYFSTNDSSGNQVWASRIQSIFTSHGAGAVAADLTFSTGSTSGATERMRITSGGFVGVGTPTPWTDLNVISTQAAGDTIAAENYNNTGSAEIAAYSNTGGVTIGTANPGYGPVAAAGRNFIWSNQNLHFISSAQSNVVFTTTGEVGIGTINPSEKLHVVGNILASGTITPSDIRLKKNIQNLESNVEKLSKIRPVSYDWIDSKHGVRKQLGVIAQELEKVYPEAVTKTKAGFLGVSYDFLIAPLLGAVQELRLMIQKNNKDIAELKGSLVRAPASHDEVKVLRKENALLKEDLSVMKDYLCRKEPSAPFCRNKVR